MTGTSTLLRSSPGGGRAYARVRLLVRSLTTPTQAAAAAVVLVRLGRGRRRRPPLRAPDAAAPGGVSVVVPARDEEARLGPCLAGLAADPAVREILVVDAGSADATAAVARA